MGNYNVGGDEVVKEKFDMGFDLSATRCKHIWLELDIHGIKKETCMVKLNAIKFIKVLIKNLFVTTMSRFHPWKVKQYFVYFYPFLVLDNYM